MKESSLGSSAFDSQCLISFTGMQPGGTAVHVRPPSVENRATIAGPVELRSAPQSWQRWRFQRPSQR